MKEEPAGLENSRWRRLHRFPTVACNCPLQQGLAVRVLLGIVILVATAVLYFVYPYWTVSRIGEAVRSRNVATLDALIDWTQVRASLKSDVRSLVLKNPPGGVQSGFAALGTMLGTTYADSLIDGAVTASAVLDRPIPADWSLLKHVVDYGFTTPTSFRVAFRVPDLPEASVTAVLELSGLSWRVTRVLLPIDAIIKASPSMKGAEQIIPSAPAPPVKARLTEKEIDALRGRIQQCWTPPASRAEGKDHVVVRIQFNQDGSLAGEPRLLTGGASAYQRAAGESALRAIRRCAPYTFLPVVKYEAWKDVEVTFDPRDMFR